MADQVSLPIVLDEGECQEDPKRSWINGESEVKGASFSLWGQF